MRRTVLLIVAALCLSVLPTTPGYGLGPSQNKPEQAVTTTVVSATTVSVSMSPPRLIFKGPFTALSTTGTNLPCEFWALNFTTTSAGGQYVSGNFTSDNPINFFVVDEAKYQDWLKAGTCGTTEDAIASQLVTTSYTFDAAIPSPGIWLIVFVNSSNAKNADGFLVANLTSLGYTVTEATTSTITPTIGTSTIVQPTTTVVLPPELVIGMVGIAIGISVGLALILRRRKRT